jgi:hypothetical protein
VELITPRFRLCRYPQKGTSEKVKVFENRRGSSRGAQDYSVITIAQNTRLGERGFATEPEVNQTALELIIVMGMHIAHAR